MTSNFFDEQNPTNQRIRYNLYAAKSGFKNNLKNFWHSDFLDNVRRPFYMDLPTKIPNVSYGGSFLPLLTNARFDFKHARNDKNAEIYDGGTHIPNANLRNYFLNDYPYDGSVDRKTMRGARYNSQSDISQTIAHDRALYNRIMEKKEEYIQNGLKIEEANKKLSDEMKKYYGNSPVATDSVSLSNFGNKIDLQKVALYNPYIDSKGHFRAQVFDVVDYIEDDEYDKNNKDKNYLSKIFTDANNLGYRDQQRGKVEPVFHIIDIDKPLEDMRKFHLFRHKMW